MNHSYATIGMRVMGIEPIWTSLGAPRSTSGGPQTRCVYQFHHTRVDSLMGGPGPGQRGNTLTVHPLVALLLYGLPS
jgi:hypothetical protein